MDNKTSLERSHSKSSNAKLTLLCVLSTLLFSLIFISLALINTYNFMLYVLIGAIVVYGLCLFGVLKFKR